MIDLTPDVRLFQIELNDANLKAKFDYKPGQFIFVSAFGSGESPFGVTSVAHRKGPIEVAVRKVGTVTGSLHELEPGAAVGVRGPFGNFFPMDQFKGKDIHIIGGGIGFAPSGNPRQTSGCRLAILLGSRPPTSPCLLTMRRGGFLETMFGVYYCVFKFDYVPCGFSRSERGINTRCKRDKWMPPSCRPSSQDGCNRRCPRPKD